MIFRTFLKICSTSMLLLLFSLCSLGQAKQASFKKGSLPNHPRILLLKGEERLITEAIKTNPLFGKVHNAIIAESNKITAQEPLQRIQVGRRLLDVSREFLKRVFYLSYSYRITLNYKYLQRAEKEMLAVAAFSDWNPSHFLDVAEMTMGMSIGYDWLYNDLKEPSRSIIRKAILQKGIEPSLDGKNNSFLTAANNWNQVCNAGMAYGAFAIHEDHPDLANSIIDRAIKTIDLPMKDYQPNGAYPEGYNYWGYGTSFNVMFLSALEKIAGTDFGLSQKPGFLNTASYYLHMTGSTGDCFNYSDSGLEKDIQPTMFWFADKIKDPSLLWVENKRIKEKNSRKIAGNRLLPSLLIWGSNIDLEKIKAPKQNIWVGDGKTPVALMRTSWQDPNAIFVGLKAGSASVNHAHMDIGSFVMESDGVRWAIDPGMQSYESLESKGLSIFGKGAKSQRWEVFRNTNYIHNTLTVNGKLQNVEGRAVITKFSDKEKFKYAITDLSQIYKNELQTVKRGIAIADKHCVIVRDEIETSGNKAHVKWLMLTKAKVQGAGSNKLQLEQDGKTLTITADDSNIVFKTWSTTPPNDYDASNKGTVLLGFEMEIPARTKKACHLTFTPGKPKNKRQDDSNKELELW